MAQELPKPSLPGLRPPDLPTASPPPPTPPIQTPPPAEEPASASIPRLNVRVSDSPKVERGGPGGEQAAGGNARIMATAIDLLVWAGLYLLLATFLPGSLAYLLSGAYIVLRDSLPFLDGQSVGKKVMKLRAVTLDGASLAGDWQTGAIRNAVLLVPFFPVVELIVLLTREDGRDSGSRLGDEWAKTKVLVIPPPSEDDVPTESALN